METKSFIRFNVIITTSKIMAYFSLILAFTLDILHDKQGTVFMFTLPFAAGLIATKQVVDYNKKKKELEVTKPTNNE